MTPVGHKSVRAKGGGDEHRRRVREGIITEAWYSAFPQWGLSFLWDRMSHWFRQNRVSFGLLVSWPNDKDPNTPIGQKVAVLSIDSASRLVVVGWSRLGYRDVMQLADQHRRVRLRVMGWLRISQDVDPEAATRVFESVRVVGVSRIPKSVRLAIGL